jgi:organic hydroperoxide reductase OsmC/OhrA
MHDRAHDICVIANSVNFPVRYEANVACVNESVGAS